MDFIYNSVKHQTINQPKLLFHYNTKSNTYLKDKV